ncbi:16S rRNA (uracil1498-N3)-methyltransferase [Sphingomonas zeicaulis]|uniref:16S rRNA (uracil(1498)-N(3))-methyltransferase n=1 Tax=Sphingomonas zeicaulis TaxID=1632740 RepID=UPI003D1C0D3C
MPATPAWPPRSTPRLFVDEPLAGGAQLRIDGAHAHYLRTVMRVGDGDPVKLFDDRSGEWLAIAAAAGKRDLLLTVSDHLRAREAVPDFWLLPAPLKRGRIDLVVEKACELGVARIQPVVTRRTVIDKFKADRLRSAAIEAAEQCDRTSLPELAEPVALDALLDTWPADRALFFADEQGGVPMAEAARAHAGPAALLIGPEGGFEDGERERIRATKGAVAVSLGPRILRAETAAIAATGVWMAVNGDWANE